MYRTYSSLIFVLVLCLNVQGQSKKSQAPNIIVIVADDLGYSDLGAYGGEIETPTLNKMASEGLRLANMNNAGMCVISRASMLTGQWWPATGIAMSESKTNLAQELQKKGYRTGLVGKWHLEGEPNDKGFDYFFGFLGGFSSYFEGSPDYRLNKTEFSGFNDFYSTDEFSTRAIDFISESKEEDQSPFFLYLSFQAPHNPLQNTKEEILKYRGKYLDGWQAIRDARLTRQVELGIIESDASLPDYPQNLPQWNSLSPEQKDMEDLRMAVYASMVERMDTGIGRIMEALKLTGEDENTLILFLSDNGTDSFSKLDEVMLKKDLLPGDNGSNYQPGTGWAYASVAPWRLYKISQHGGGIKTGAIAWWAGKLENKGKVTHTPVHLVDIMPTFLEIAGSPSQNMMRSFAGESFLPLLKNKKWQRKGSMFFQYMDNRAIRAIKWELVEVDGSGWELYNNIEDPMETNNLANEKPKLVSQLETDWLEWWKKENNSTGYKPVSTAGSPHYAPQGDMGTGKKYIPTAMTARLKHKYDIE